VVNVLGLDIGGANTKAVFIRVQNGEVAEFEATMEYFPFWKHDQKEVCIMLSSLKKRLVSSEKIDCLGVTLTAELSDVYSTKREGVNQILDCVCEAFADVPFLVLDINAELRSVEWARAEPLKVASANWAATGWMAAQTFNDCVIIDIGSTTTSIIPIVQGKICAHGKTDLDKLMFGELVYTGSLRTNVATIVNYVPLRGGIARVASELFAQSGDIHLILGNITEANYTSETADGKGKTVKEASARLAHVLCADTEMLTEHEILQIAEYVCTRQVAQIADGLEAVYSQLKVGFRQAVPLVVAGLGRNFLARKAAEKVGVAKVVDLGCLLPMGVALAAPAAGVALMVATRLEGKKLSWTQ
jgi:probable H4MPT-linked C1 transfer pathway protein